MSWSLRARIVVWALAASALLVMAQAAFFLSGYSDVFYVVVDESLREELNEVRAHGIEAVEEFIRFEEATDSDELEVFFEIRDGQNEVVVLSENLGGVPLPETTAGVETEGVWFRDELLGVEEERLRVAEAKIDGHRIQVAMRLGHIQHIFAAIRLRAILTFLLFALPAAAGAYLVASRALQPLRQLIEKGKEFSIASEGNLPVAGTGDEMDELAVVLNDLLNRVRAHVERVRRFTADAAHELRTPLTAVRGHLELLANESPAAGERIGEIIEEVDRLGALVNQLLLLERLESGPAGAHAPLDLAEVARSVVDHLQIVAKDQGVELEIDLEPTLVEGDLSQLRQLFFNLLDNALHFTPRGGRIAVTVRNRRDGVEATVRDTGPGVPPESTERVFERFFSAPGRFGTGTGLGLPIARAIALAHGGSLVVGAGTCGEFVLRLPALAPTT